MAKTRKLKPKGNAKPRAKAAKRINNIFVLHGDSKDLLEKAIEEILSSNDLRDSVVSLSENDIVKHANPFVECNRDTKVVIIEDFTDLSRLASFFTRQYIPVVIGKRKYNVTPMLILTTTHFTPTAIASLQGMSNVKANVTSFHVKPDQWAIPASATYDQWLVLAEVLASDNRYGFVGMDKTHYIFNDNLKSQELKLPIDITVDEARKTIIHMRYLNAHISGIEAANKVASDKANEDKQPGKKAETKE